MVLKSFGTLQQVQFPVSDGKFYLLKSGRESYKGVGSLVLSMGTKGYNEMSDEDVNRSLKKVREFGRGVGQGLTSREKKELLMKFERTRHLMVWGINSTILNHSHIMYIIKCLYEPRLLLRT